MLSTYDMLRQNCDHYEESVSSVSSKVLWSGVTLASLHPPMFSLFVISYKRTEGKDPPYWNAYPTT